MSFPALAAVSKMHLGSAAEKLIALAYADRHNEETGCAYPSLAWLCEFSSLNRKTVIAVVSRLEACGFLSDTKKREGKTGQIKVYKLSFETVPKTERFQKRNSSNFSGKESQKRDTDTIREPVSSEAKASSLSRGKFPPPPDVPDEIWKDFLASPKRRKAGMSATAYAGITNNLRICAEHGFPPGETLALAVERGWTTVKLEWVLEDGRRTRTNGLGRNQSGDGLSATTRAARDVFGLGASH